MNDEIRLLLGRMVQIGKVTAVDNAKKQVRVYFEESGMTSGWLCVLQRSGGGLDIQPDGGHMNVSY